MVPYVFRPTVVVDAATKVLQVYTAPQHPPLNQLVLEVQDLEDTGRDYHFK